MISFNILIVLNRSRLKGLIETNIPINIVTNHKYQDKDNNTIRLDMIKINIVYLKIRIKMLSLKLGIKLISLKIKDKYHI